MRKVAITGGLSSGKSTACRFLKEFGAYVAAVQMAADKNYTKMEEMIRLIFPG